MKYARQWALSAGIEDVVDITDRDILGVPVYIAHRPSAGPGEYAYGKGLAAVDAEVGAYMEGIEYHHAEPRPEGVPTHWGTPRDVVGVADDPGAILELGPRLGQDVDLDGPLRLATAHDVATGDEVRLPAELVLCPAPDVGQALFGASTNGLASGNSELEATVHGLSELIERDIWSFEFVRRSSQRVEPGSLPRAIGRIVERAASHGLELVVRTIVNEYRMAFFVAFLFDPSRPTLRWFNGGWGCHLDRSIALTRAVSEAAQSRLAYIHGGRGEPRRPAAVLSRRGDRDERAHIEARIAQVRDPRGMVDYAEIDDETPLGSLESTQQTLLDRIRAVTERSLYRCVYPTPDRSLSVVRLIAPMLESFSDTRARVGFRLKAALEHSARAAAGGR